MNRTLKFLKAILFILLLTFYPLNGTPFQPKTPSGPPSSVLLLNDTSAWYHWGCTATCTQLKVSILRDCGFLLSSIPIQANAAIIDYPLEAEKFDDILIFETFCKSNPDLIQNLRKADFIIVNGEGTLHGTKAGPLRLLYVAYVAKKHFHKHVEIINHSVYPQDSLELDLSENAAKLYKKVYQMMDFVAVREKYSADLLEKMGISAVCSFDCLPLYIKETYLPKKRDGTKKHKIIISGSVAWETEGAAALINYIDFMYQKGYEILFLTGAQRDLAKDDLKLIEFLKDCHPGGWSVVEAHSLDEWLQILEEAELLVSGRFHHSIAAACLGTPFIALNSNTPKIQALESYLHSLPMLHYSDPHLFQKLKEQTDILMDSPPDPSLSSNLVEELSLLAQKNFSCLRKLALSGGGSLLH